MSIEWLCARCAEKTGKTPEPDPVVLRLCTECKVENWVRPFGHSGEGVIPSDEEYEAAHENQIEEARKGRERAEKIRKDNREKIKKVTEELPKEEAPEETVLVAEDVPTEEEVVVEEPDPKEEEIAKLKAQLAELEK